MVNSTLVSYIAKCHISAYNLSAYNNMIYLSTHSITQYSIVYSKASKGMLILLISVNVQFVSVEAHHNYLRHNILNHKRRQRYDTKTAEQVRKRQKMDKERKQGHDSIEIVQKGKGGDCRGYLQTSASVRDLHLPSAFNLNIIYQHCYFQKVKCKSKCQEVKQLKYDGDSCTRFQLIPSPPTKIFLSLYVINSLALLLNCMSINFENKLNVP